jgi:hypothetical protein
MKIEPATPLFSELVCSFWLRKINTCPDVLAYANIGCPENRYPKLIIYISELIIHVLNLRFPG